MSRKLSPMELPFVYWWSLCILTVQGRSRSSTFAYIESQYNYYFLLEMNDGLSSISLRFRKVAPRRKSKTTHPSLSHRSRLSGPPSNFIVKFDVQTAEVFCYTFLVKTTWFHSFSRFVSMHSYHRQTYGDISLIVSWSQIASTLWQ